MKLSNFIFIFSLFVFLLSCTKKIDLKSEIEAVQKAESSWLKAVSDQDIDSLLSFFEDDAILMPSNQTAIVEKEAFRLWQEAAFEREYLVVVNTVRLLDRQGWEFGR